MGGRSTAAVLELRSRTELQPAVQDATDRDIPVFHSQCEDPRSPVRRFVGSEAGPGADSRDIPTLCGCLGPKVSPPALTFRDRPDLIGALITQREYVGRLFHLTPVRGGRDGQATSEVR
jgi:hypothetical protein